MWNYAIKRRPLGHWTIRARFSSGATFHTHAPAFFGKLRQTPGTSLTTFLFAQDNDSPASDLPGLPAPETSHSGRSNRPRSRCYRIRLGRPRRYPRFCGTRWGSSRCKLRYGKMKTPRWNPSIHLGESQAAEFRTVLKRLRALFAVDKMLGLAVEGLFEGHSLQDGVFGQLDHLYSFLSPHLYSNIILGLSIAFEPKDFACSMSRRIESPRRQGNKCHLG